MEIHQARVRNGRLVLDEPTDLPEGKVVKIMVLDQDGDDVNDEMSDEERAALDRSIDRGIAQIRAGEGIPAEVIVREIRARRT
jgi:hypothetical protein